MYHYLYDEEGFFIGMTETRPEHNRWTLSPNTYSFIKEKWFGDKWDEGATEEEIIEHNETIYKELDVEYTKKIYELVEKHVQKNIIDGTPIPKEVLDERERLKAEFRNLTNKDLKK